MGNEGQTSGANEAPLGQALGQFLRAHKAAVIEAWQAAVRAYPEAKLHGWPVPCDHIAPMLDHLSGMAESFCNSGSATFPPDLADAIACERLRQGYDAGALIREFAVLREAIMQQWLTASAVYPVSLGPGMRVLNRALDRVLGDAVERYVLAQNRTLQALDAVCAGTLQRDLDECLQKLLAVLDGACASVDTAAILLSDGVQLRVHAAVGLDREVTDQLRIPLGRGFAGMVATRGTPVTLDAEGIEHVVLSPVLRNRGLRVLYGIPLIHKDELVGVGHIGSLHAADFSEQDKQIFAAMAYRATIGIAQHLLQQALRDHNAQLARAKRVAEQVVGIVSHDLRSPITAISLNTESLLRQGPSAPARIALERIHHSTCRAERMITDLLDLTRTRMGSGMSLHPAPTDLLSVATQVVQELREVHPGNAFTLTSRGDLHGVWDAERLAQVLSNLLNNAAKYGRAQTPVTLTLDAEADGVAMMVHNHGAPIAAEDLKHLFEPMWRGADGRRKGEGVGLGLFIVDAIVRSHGGFCQVRSSQDAGTTFRVALPRIAPDMALDSRAQSH